MPHSDIHGSKPARGSPWLFAACYVLHRLLVPRHPPNALIALTRTMHRNHPCHAASTHSILLTRLNAQRCFLFTHKPAKASSRGSDQPTEKQHAQTRTNRFTLTKNNHRTSSQPGAQRSGYKKSNTNSLTTDPSPKPDITHQNRQRHQQIWWRRTGSNRRPPACKAGALPAELRPLIFWWAREDLNLRPHAYQACALTN